MEVKGRQEAGKPLAYIGVEEEKDTEVRNNSGGIRDRERADTSYEHLTGE